jgi:glycosyltransferase involved in cell wall biosynthesis
LEAAAAGCVCIASDVGNARELCVPSGSVVLLPSPLGELDTVSDTQFFAAAETDLPEHLANIAASLRRVRQDCPTFAAGVPATRARLLALHRMERMTRSYIEAYTMACRGGVRSG